MRHLYILIAALLASVSSFAITGPANVCINTTTTYTDPAPGGMWSSSNPAIASIGATTGVLTSYSAGTIVLTYSNGTVTNTLTITVVTSLPSIAFSATVVCSGSTISLSNAVSGGTWTSNNTARATVDATGNVTGVSPGSVTIQYKLGGSCTVSQNITVYGVLSSISGPTSVCVGNNIMLSNDGATGTWSTASPSIIGVSGAGYVWGYAAGSAIVTFTNGTLCGAPSATYPITVSAGLSANTGSMTICAGTTSPLSNTTSGGTWSSNNTNVATVDPVSGMVYAITGGYLNITYKIASGCYYSSSVTVNAGFTALPAASTLCTGSNLNLGSSSYTGTWSSNNPTVASVNSSGMVYGLSAGTATITFFNTGCGAPMGTDVVTVIAGVTPVLGAPTTAICPGSTVTLSNATPGGTWVSYNTPVATVVASTGMVTAVATGGAVIAYSVSGCSKSATITVGSPTLSISGPSTVCVGNSDAMTATLSGGTWTSSNTAVATISGSGVITPVMPGTTTITYNYSGTCATGSPTHNVTVVAGITPIIGPSTVCAGTAVTLSNTTTGGTWSASITAAGTFNTTTLVLTTTTPGTAVIRYTVGSCYTTSVISVIAGVPAITGASSLCVSTTSALSNITAGGTWSSSNPSVATIDAAGLVSGVSAGTTTITYTAGTGCFATLVITIGSSLTITASATQSCNGVYTLSASGGTSYSWAPATGLSCATCATTTVNPTSTITYVITGTSSSCSGTGNVTVNGNRIRGNISYTGISSDSFRVWLIKYNPSDSTVLAVDSMTTCMAGTTPYYQFTSPAAGSYTVKAKKLGTIPGISGYIPTYGLASANWFGATAIAHGTGTDNQTINMIYGTVPTGPGFITGNVYFGAGKGTSGEAPAADMLILLRNTATNVLTYAYTDANGLYSFGNLAYGDYVIYPEEFDYYTTPSAVITLSAATPSAPGINFKQHTDYGTITPFAGPSAVTAIASGHNISIFPNPASDHITIKWQDMMPGNADVAITDITGRAVYNTTTSMSTANGSAQIATTGFTNGIYFISVRSADLNYVSKIRVQR